MMTVLPLRSAMETVFASFFTLSICAAIRGTSGNLSPTLTFSVVSSAATGVVDASTQRAAANAARAAKRNIGATPETRQANRWDGGIVQSNTHGGKYELAFCEVSSEFVRGEEFLHFNTWSPLTPQCTPRHDHFAL